jgi:hypothetical protein
MTSGERDEAVLSLKWRVAAASALKCGFQSLAMSVGNTPLGCQEN